MSNGDPREEEGVAACHDGPGGGWPFASLAPRRKRGALREEEEGTAFFTRPQGGGGGHRIGFPAVPRGWGRYRVAVPSGRRRRTPPISEAQGGGGASGRETYLP